MTAPCIIIGASHAAAQLSLTIRQQGWQDDIIIIGEEAHLPYQRPPLSKAFLAEDKTLDNFPIKPASAYEKANVSFKLNTRVTAINRQEQNITLDNGETMAYGKLALCTGASVFRLPLPNSQLDGVFYLRNADDALAIKNSIKPNKRAVIIGGGFIGLEIAAVLAQKNLHVTVLEAQSSILQRVVSPEVSQYFTELHESYGVNIKTSTVAVSLEGEESVTSVTCQDDEVIPADIVIIGVGVRPETSLAEQCGLSIDNGICVNEFAQTDDPNIVAAGDCASYFHELYQTRVRIESIQNAMEQAKAAAASINGKQVSFSNNVPRFWSDQYDIKLQICGLLDGYDQIEIEQDLVARKLNAFYLKDNKLIAAIAINNPALLTKAQNIIKTGEPVSEENIRNLLTG